MNKKRPARSSTQRSRRVFIRPGEWHVLVASVGSCWWTKQVSFVH